MLTKIGLYAAIAIAIFSSGMFYQMSRSAKAVVKDQTRQATGVNELHKGALKRERKLLRTISALRKNPTVCGKTKMRQVDIDALGGVK